MTKEKDRDRLKQHLNSVLKVSEEKFKTDNRDNHERMKWGRLIIHAVVAYGKLLETDQLDKLMEEIEKIKQHIGMEVT